MVEGVLNKPVKVIPDERGRIMEMLRSDDPLFRKFGQVYVTTVYPGVIKGWHYHKIQTDFVMCSSGMIKLVVAQGDITPMQEITAVDWPNRVGRIKQYFIGEHNPQMVVIPPGIYHGWKGIGTKEAVIVCMTTEPYNYENPDEYRVDPHGNEIPYDWRLKDG